MNFIGLVAFIYLWQYSDSETTVVHYNNITLRNCGLNVFLAKSTPKSCFEWHQSIREEENAMRNIQHGRNAEIEEFPFTVLIAKFFRGLDIPYDWCTGSIVNELWIITAAHCMLERARNTRIYVGLTQWPDSTAPYIRAQQYFRHENFTRNFNDIGLIKLETKIAINTASESINSICLPSRDTRLSGSQLATVTGWGFIGDRWSEKSDKLRTTQIRLHDSQYVANDSLILDQTIRYGRGCVGDSGGPLLQYVNRRAVLIGIMQSSGPRNGEHCGLATAQQFTAVPHYIDWIINTIRNH